MTATTRPRSVFITCWIRTCSPVPTRLYQRLREEDPVHWDPYLHAWVVTRYADVVTVLQQFLGSRTPSPEKLSALGLDHLVPIARVMVKQMLFLDPPAHGRIRRLAAAAFTPRRVGATQGAHPRDRRCTHRSRRRQGRDGSDGRFCQSTAGHRDR